ncbi:MAG TPA: hypothetical protein VF070_06685 [Streptosporangiaceae bacterium]
MDQLNSARHTDNDAIRGEVIPPEEDTEDTADTAGTTPQAGYPQTYLHKVASARPGDDPDDAEYAEDEAPSDAVTEHRDTWDRAAEDRAAEDRAGAFAGDTMDEREPEPASVAEDPVATTTPDLIPPGAAIPADEQRGRHRAAEADAVPEAAVPETGVPKTAVPEDAVPEDALPKTGAPETGVPVVAVPEGGIPAPQGRRPGDEPIPPSLEDSLLPGGSGIREEWLRVQAQFVDDPRVAVSEAASIIADVASRLEAAVRQRQDTLRVRWDGNSQADTEALRVTMQQYRHLLERLVGL